MFNRASMILRAKNLSVKLVKQLIRHQAHVHHLMMIPLNVLAVLRVALPFKTLLVAIAVKLAIIILAQQVLHRALLLMVMVIR